MCNAAYRVFPIVTSMVLLSAVNGFAQIQIEAIRMLPGGHPELTIAVDSGPTYILEATENFREWNSILEFERKEPTTRVIDSQTGKSAQRFYRVSEKKDQAAEDLRIHRQQWSSLDISEYTYRFNWNCFCVPEYTQPVFITVQQHRITQVIDVESGEPLSFEDFSRYRTIDGLFNLIQDAIEQDAHQINVVYHPSTGYPVSSWIDYNEFLADEERGFQTWMADSDLLQISEEDETIESVKGDAFFLDEVAIEGNFLELNLNYGGGCREHFFILSMIPPVFKESFPVQADLYLTHQANSDRCKAFVRETRSFDLSSLAELHFGAYSTPGPIILNLFRFSGDEPESIAKLDYSPVANEHLLLLSTVSQTWFGGPAGSGWGTDFTFRLKSLVDASIDFQELWIDDRKYEPSIQNETSPQSETVKRGDNIRISAAFRVVPTNLDEVFDLNEIEYKDVPEKQEGPEFEGAVLIRYTIGEESYKLILPRIRVLEPIAFP